MEYAVVGWPEDGPQLRLDHREFSYAGKFVMSNTGKAVARETTPTESSRSGRAEREATREPTTESTQNENLVGAVAFNEDRTDAGTAWLRYVTVRDSRRGEGVGARLTRFAADRLLARGYDRVQIAVNNPFAYHALYKAGFGYTGEKTGLAELVLVRSAEDDSLADDASNGDDDVHSDDDSPAAERGRSAARYQSGLDVYRERDLSAQEREFLAAKAGERPPAVVDSP